MICSCQTYRRCDAYSQACPPVSIYRRGIDIGGRVSGNENPMGLQKSRCFEPVDASLQPCSTWIHGPAMYNWSNPVSASVFDRRKEQRSDAYAGTESQPQSTVRPLQLQQNTRRQPQHVSHRIARPNSPAPRQTEVMKWQETR